MRRTYEFVGSKGSVAVSTTHAPGLGCMRERDCLRNGPGGWRLLVIRHQHVICLAWCETQLPVQSRAQSPGRPARPMPWKADSRASSQGFSRWPHCLARGSAKAAPGGDRHDVNPTVATVPLRVGRTPRARLPQGPRSLGLVNLVDQVQTRWTGWVAPRQAQARGADSQTLSYTAFRNLPLTFRRSQQPKTRRVGRKRPAGISQQENRNIHLWAADDGESAGIEIRPSRRLHSFDLSFEPTAWGSRLSRHGSRRGHRSGT